MESAKNLNRRGGFAVAKTASPVHTPSETQENGRYIRAGFWGSIGAAVGLFVVLLVFFIIAFVLSVAGAHIMDIINKVLYGTVASTVAGIVAF